MTKPTQTIPLYQHGYMPSHIKAEPFASSYTCSTGSNNRSTDSSEYMLQNTQTGDIPTPELTPSAINKPNTVESTNAFF